MPTKRSGHNPLLFILFYFCVCARAQFWLSYYRFSSCARTRIHLRAAAVAATAAAVIVVVVLAPATMVAVVVVIVLGSGFSALTHCLIFLLLTYSRYGSNSQLPN